MERSTDFFRIMNECRDKKVWLHCVVNKRVSAFLYQYQRVVEGWSHEEALKVMLPTWQPNDIWQEFMKLSPG
jgi:hypothetical protein